MRVAPEIVLSNEEHAELSKLVRSKLSSVRFAQRARIVLLAADGMQNKAIAQPVSYTHLDVYKRQAKTAAHGYSGKTIIVTRGKTIRKRLLFNREYVDRVVGGYTERFYIR